MGEHFTGLEIQEECAEMAARSVKYNNLEDRVSIRQGDIKEAVSIFGAASFHVVTCNPPYMIGQHGLTNPHMPKAIARHEILCTLEDVVSQASKRSWRQRTFLHGTQTVQTDRNYAGFDEI